MSKSIQEIFWLMILMMSWTAPPTYKYKFSNPIEIEQDLKSSENSIVLFFEWRDGSTEDVHREFLKAKAILASENIHFEVFELNGKLSERLEKKFQVYKLPKVRFFRRGKPTITYNQLNRVQLIVAWIRKVLRVIPTESKELSKLDELNNLIYGGEREFSLYVGDRNHKDFSLYDQFAKSKLVRFFWTSSPLLLEIMKQIQKTKTYDPNNYPRFDQELHVDYPTYEQIVLEKMEVTMTEQFEPKVFFVKVVKVSGENYFFVLSPSVLTINDMRVELRKNIFTVIENVSSLKDDIERRRKSEDVSYLNIIYNRADLPVIKEKLPELLGIAGNNFKLSLIDLSMGNNFQLQELFKYERESIFILDYSKMKTHRRKYKLEIKFGEDLIQNISQYIQRFQKKELQEYIKSSPLKDDALIDELFVELVGIDFEEKVYSGFHSSLVVFYRQQDENLKFIMNMIKKYESLMVNFKFFRIDIVENEVKDNLEGKIFPFVKIFYGKGKSLSKSMSFNPDENAFLLFIKDLIVNTEL